MWHFTRQALHRDLSSDVQSQLRAWPERLRQRMSQMNPILFLMPIQKQLNVRSRAGSDRAPDQLTVRCAPLPARSQSGQSLLARYA